MPAVGFKHTEETKAKMRERKLANPTKYWQGKKRGPSSEATKAKQSAALIGRAKPNGFGEKLSKAIMGHPAYHKKGPRLEYKGIRMRSSYEIKTAEALDAMGIRWEYEPRRFWFDSFTYTPDFFLVDESVYWEVKGWFGPKSKTKVEAFREKFADIPLVVMNLPSLKMLWANRKG